MRKIYLSERFFVLFSLVQVAGALALVFPPVFHLYIMLMALFALTLVLDHRSLAGPDAFDIQLRIARTPELGEPVVLEGRLVSRSPATLGLSSVELRAPQVRTIRFSAPYLRVRPQADESGEWVYPVRFAGHAFMLGYDKITSFRLRAYSRRRLWCAMIDTRNAPVDFRVMPTRRPPSEETFQQITAGQKIFYQGNRRRLRAGASEQFRSVRDYQYPDETRHIDPKKTAKFNRLMTRVFESFHQHHLVIALDMGRALSGEIGTSSKHDYYLSAALALAQTAVKSQDRVSFVAFSQKIHHLIRPTNQLREFYPIFNGSARLDAVDSDTNFELLPASMGGLAAQRSIVVILTDATRPSVQEALMHTLPALCRQHLVVVIGLLDEKWSLERGIAASAAQPLTLDSYSELLYEYWLDDGMRLFKSRAAGYGAGLFVVSESDWLGGITKLYEFVRQSLRI